jgi:antitoxin (DNA-binding transcriptional repressor) of toxin-antitoxin stability system
MKTMTAVYAHSHVSELLDSAIAGKPVVLTRNGKPVAIVVPANFLTAGRDYPSSGRQLFPDE